MSTDTFLEFQKARRSAFFRQILSKIKQEPTLLLSFDLVKEHLDIASRTYIGLREIDVDGIVGSVDRYQDFDREFFPLTDDVQSKWTSISQAWDEGKELPPITLYEIGGVYFVEDGNHRVSVAKGRGMTSLWAHVYRFTTNVPLDKETDVKDLIIKAEYSAFLRQTRLDELRPDAWIEFSRPGRYEALLNHIEVHRYFKGIDEGRNVPYEEAVTSWYDNLYKPLVDEIRGSDVLEQFPQRTEADLYVWISDHLYFLREAYGKGVGTRQAALDFAEEYGLPWFLRFLQSLD